jgi:hypothetical protein
MNTFWFSRDNHLSESEFAMKIRNWRGYIISDDDTPKYFSCPYPHF